ncbi:hypothetical protein QC823_14315 [Halomonas vilamensis]|uniref:Uncharacterized protein n=1 Tax=Vreelandella vilamensis TaxID=531309 RepID=A0ABU1H780_9GAMM|nr:hypothetical protein [Halomonas vilamensis]MDR5900150.1 hypothetical protein [Halomonas vilamensis]
MTKDVLPSLPSIDRRVFELLLAPENSQFTVRGIRNQYAEHYGIVSEDRAELRRFLYENIKKLIRVGAVKQDDQRRKRDQIFHVLSTINEIPINLDGEIFESWHSRQLSSLEKRKSKAPESFLIDSDKDFSDNKKQNKNQSSTLEKKLREVQSEFLTTMGEVETLRELMNQCPNLQSSIAHYHREAYDHSARLIGRVRALEKVIEKVKSE